MTEAQWWALLAVGALNALATLIRACFDWLRWRREQGK